MTSMKDTAVSSVSKKLIYLLIAGILIGGIVLVYRTKMRPLRDSDNTPAQEHEYPGKLVLMPEGNKKVYVQGEEIIINLYGDSRGKEVSGFDLLLTVLESDVSLVKAEGLIPGFEVSSVSHPESISITGLRDLQALKSPIFNNEPVARLTFMPHKTGQIDFHIAFQIGQTIDSNLVVGTDDILGEAQSTSVFVTQTPAITMKQGSRVKLESGLNLQLVKLTQADPQCLADCSLQADFQLMTDDATVVDSVTVMLGGFEGDLSKEVELRGYLFSIRRISDTTLEVNRVTLE